MAHRAIYYERIPSCVDTRSRFSRILPVATYYVVIFPRSHIFHKSQGSYLLQISFWHLLVYLLKEYKMPFKEEDGDCANI